MTTWRVTLFVYLLFGAALTLWLSPRWWREMEHHAGGFYKEHFADRGLGMRLTGWWVVGAISIASLIFDVAFWPRVAYRLWQTRNLPPPPTS